MPSHLDTSVPLFSWDSRVLPSLQESKSVHHAGMAVPSPAARWRGTVFSIGFTSTSGAKPRGD